MNKRLYVSFFVMLILLSSGCSTPQNDVVESVASVDEVIVEEKDAEIAALKAANEALQSTIENNTLAMFELEDEITLLEEAIEALEVVESNSRDGDKADKDAEIKNLEEQLEMLDLEMQVTNSTIEWLEYLVNAYEKGIIYRYEELSVGQMIGGIKLDYIHYDDAMGSIIEADFSGEFKTKGIVSWNMMYDYPMIWRENNDSEESGVLDFIILYKSDYYADFYDMPYIYMYIGREFDVLNKEEFKSMFGAENYQKLMDGQTFEIEGTFKDYSSYIKMESEGGDSAEVIEISHVAPIDY